MDRTALTLATIAVLLAGCAAAPPAAPPARMLGVPSALGNGTVAGYAELDASGAPKAIGVVFSAGSLENLPAASTDGHHCFDANKDGTLDPATECLALHERVLPLPSEAARRADLPFKWALVDWNPHGHIPPGVYDKPHFDVHFYIDTIENVFAIEPGPCGPERVRCDHFARARVPVPAGYMHADFKDVEAVAPAMGNHLVDLTSPEFKGAPFTRTWIYGAYDGRVTFYEEMVTLAYLKSAPDRCFPIKAAALVAVSGYYPTQSCLRYDRARTEYTVSLEGFALREGRTPPR